ncbi:unnamed protein product [Rotaria sp. Silwood1]|nr:unnamed protein product [Rotaria sp. Silwood1]CAF0785760.1 unnamed protein product [Rotaria sp. Silwood1]CAF3323384.1 unnamed protein product [Rotaria sp. Silwood1]CAF3339096.1 unnamed protein product [Rotaria sp. Silwood1]CAF3347139.1 unnamed protein product [Rotaria sp. Silwood1]
MIPVLRSIDGLLNRFDELSQRHASFVSNFETSFTGIENPLRDVARDEEEQRKTAESVLKASTEKGDQIGSFGTVEDFNNRITKSRSHNRPPSYSSNDTSSFYNRIPSRSSWATAESASPPRISTLRTRPVTVETNTSQSVTSISTENRFEPKIRLTTKIKPKFVPQNLPTTRRYAHSPITTFTMETAIRLSRPRTYHQSVDHKEPSKRIYRRPKSHQNIKNEASESSVTSVSFVPSLESAQTKRTNPRIIKSSPKKLKADNRFVTDNSKRIPMSNYPRPAIFLAPPPTICITFPMQPELQSSRVVIIPKATTTQKTINVFTKKRSVIPPKRLMQLMA